MEYTLGYSQNAGGWTSFYSFIPDWMIGMNNFFYTFKGGNLYKHNVNANRNTFYQNWWDQVGEPNNAFTPSSLTSVFNDVPLQNKLFKTLNLEGDDSWSATLETDIQNSGFIEKDWFEKKEQSYFAFVRNSGTVPAGTDEYALRSLNGVGRSSSVVGPSSATEINFSINPLIAIGTIASVGDYLYYSLPPSYSTPVLCGQITDIVQNYPAGDNYFVVDTTIPGGIVPPIQNAYFLYIKNSVAESHGVLGHYCVFTLENDNTSKVELFAVESEVMKSYP
jgi:hypothetical protein